MTIESIVWCTVHYATLDFTAISEIGQLHEGLGSKICHFMHFFLSPAWACVYRV